MSKRIPVVEDHEDNRRILRDLLRATGFELIEARIAECTDYVSKPYRPRELLAKIREYLPL